MTREGDAHQGDPAHVVLIGFRAAGKTTVGRELARRMGLGFVDTDELVAARAGASVAEILRRDGEGALRRLEHAVLAGLARDPPCVVATGGGIVEYGPSVEVLKRLGRVVWLDPPFAAIEARLRRSRGRPALVGSDPVKEAGMLLSRRRPMYESLAEIHVRPLGWSVEETARRVERALRDRASGPSGTW